MSGDAGAAGEMLVRRLFQEHGAALIAYATRLMGDRRAGEEVVQETLVQAWRSAGDEAITGDRSAVRRQLFTIARKVAQRDNPDSGPDPMAVLSAFERLPPEQRAVLRSLYFQGRGLTETAETLGVPAGDVKSRTYHALKRLREAVHPLVPAEGAAR